MRRLLAWSPLLPAAVGVALLVGGDRPAQSAAPDQQAEIAALQEQVADLEERLSAVEDDALPSGCIAYSDRKYVKERVDGFGKHRWRLPLMVWNMADPICRPNPAKVWRPK